MTRHILLDIGSVLKVKLQAAPRKLRKVHGGQIASLRYTGLSFISLHFNNLKSASISEEGGMHNGLSVLILKAIQSEGEQSLATSKPQCLA